MAENSSLSILFFGTPDFAVASLKALVENGYPVVGVVTAPDRPAGRGRKLRSSPVKDYALAQGLEVFQPLRLKDASFVRQVRELNARLQVVVAFRMLPEVIWNMPPLGTINVHASLLPQYRGAAPINWALINGETETGVTTFQLRHEIDTGDLLLQQKVAIAPADDAGSLYEKLKMSGASLLIRTIQSLEAGDLEPIRQDLSQPARQAPKIFKEMCKIDWNQPGRQILNFVRGLSPIPGAFTFLNGQKFRIRAASLIPENPRREPGSFETDGKTFLRFAATDGWIACERVQLEGKKEMPVTDFLRGFRLENQG